MHSGGISQKLWKSTGRNTQCVREPQVSLKKMGPEHHKEGISKLLLSPK